MLICRPTLARRRPADFFSLAETFADWKKAFDIEMGTLNAEKVKSKKMTGNFNPDPKVSIQHPNLHPIGSIHLDRENKI